LKVGIANPRLPSHPQRLFSAEIRLSQSARRTSRAVRRDEGPKELAGRERSGRL